MNHQIELPLFQPPCFGDFGKGDLINLSDFDKMVSRSDRATLCFSSPFCRLGDGIGIGSCDHSMALNVLEILFKPISPIHRPLRPFDEQLVIIVFNEPLSGSVSVADTGWDEGKDQLNQSDARPLVKVGKGNRGDCKPYAAIDVVADPSRADDPFIDINGGHYPDG